MDESILFEMRSKIKKLNDKKYFSNENTFVFDKPIDFASVKEGDKVFVKKLNSPGVVTSKNVLKKKIDVSVGNFKVSVSADELSQYYERQSDTPKPKKTVSIKTQLATRLLSNEINVIGQTVDEAIPNIDSFIDACLLASINEISIIHGRGTGALRKGIHDHLKKHKSVAEFRLGAYGEGDRGVTIVKLK